MLKTIHAFLIACALLLFGAGAAYAAPDAEIPPELVSIANSLKPMRGAVPIPEAKATLDLGEAYDFYGPQDAARILVDLWGNPPGAEKDVLGLVMPAGASPLADGWGAVVTYEDTGYVSDDDASDADFDEILSQLKESGEASNEERRRQGYPAVHLLGWAENPHYDAATHSVVWARDLQFEGDNVHALNYDLRTLGRHGVLSLNFVSSMPELGSIQSAARQFAEHARFDKGARYQDFDELTDKKAEFGIAGLVAAGVGVAAAKKIGLLAILLKFGKVIIVGAIAVLAAMRNKLTRLFGRQEEDAQYAYSEYPEEELAAPVPADEGDEEGEKQPPSA